MKKQNRINPIEAHFEKLILVVVSVVLLGVLAMQFLTQPNAVQVPGAATPVPPGQVFNRIEEDAEVVLDQMRNPNPALPDVPEQDVLSRFVEVSGLAAVDSVRVTRMGESIGVEAREIGPAGSEAATVYAMPALPVPAGLAAATHRATVDPYVAVTNAELAAYLPSEQPFDALAVSVEGVVNGASLLASLEDDPDGDSGPMRPLPLSWWRGNLELLGVEVERQELSPTGSWGGATIIAGVPGHDSLLGQARDGEVTPAELVDIARTAQQRMREVAQPSFPQTIAGADWVRPSELATESGLSEEDQEIARLERQYASLGRRVDGLSLQLERIGAGGGGERTGGERRGRGGEGGGQSRRTTVDRDQQQRDRIQAQIDSIDAQMVRIAADLADLGAPVDGTDDRSRDRNEPEPPLPSLLEAEDIPVWVHDFSAEPGKSYRYRMRLVVNNPLYAKDQYLSGDQRSVAASPTLEGSWSGWTDTIDVETDTHFFVISASENDAIGNGPRAAVEVYEFYYGFWRRGTAALQPGDTIHADASLPENLLLWDAERLQELARTGESLPGLNQPGTRPGESRIRDFDRRREFEGSPEGGGEIPSLRGRETTRPSAGSDEEGELPEGVERAPETLDLRLATMLLDVSTTPGADGGTIAVFRGTDGRLVTRDSADDRSSPLYRRLSSNAREGEEQGEPEPDPRDARQPIVVPGNEDRRLREEGGGGGGG